MLRLQLRESGEIVAEASDLDGVFGFIGEAVHIVLNIARLTGFHLALLLRFTVPRIPFGLSGYRVQRPCRLLVQPIALKPCGLWRFGWPRQHDLGPMTCLEPHLLKS